MDISYECPLIIVPGGGIFADQVRNLQKSYTLNEMNAHFMAILSESLTGYLIHSLISNSKLISNINELKFDYWIKDNRSIIPILLPFDHFLEFDPLPHSWDVTSDSIAYYFGSLLNAEKIILIKDVDGLFDDDPKMNTAANFIEKITALDLIKLKKKTCVDAYLPILIKERKKPCYLISGLDATRIKKFLKDESVKQTIIFE